MWWLGLTAVAAPQIEVRWRADVAHLTVAPETGTTLSADAPARVDVSVDERLRVLSLDGAHLQHGVWLGEVRGTHLQAALELQVCEKATGICRPESLTVSADVPNRKKGVLPLVGVPKKAAAHSSPFNADATPALDAAFASAAASGNRVLLDFSAVWCPPCNLLAAEVLHAPDAETTLAGVEVAIVDVDHPSSWPLKDRYAVGSYPTVVVTDAEGTEYGRLVGYPGREAVLDFLSTTTQPAPDYTTTDPTTLTPDEAARGALALLDAGETDVAAWLARAVTSDSWSAHVARFRTTPSADEVTWLVDHAPERALDWLPHAGPWGEGDGTPALQQALAPILAAVGPVEAADVLWYAAQLHEPEQARADYAAAASLLRASFTGDFAHDRGHIEFLATLLERAGQSDAALDLLDTTARQHPDDPTWFLAGAYHLNERGEHAAALRRAEQAMNTAWGDIRLRVAHTMATALTGLERADEAAAVAENTLAELPAPDADLKVRTHRYREKLASFLGDDSEE